MKKALLITNILFKNIKNLSLKSLLKLTKLCITHPLFSILTFWATVKTYSIAEKLFPHTHSSNGVGNAFRHALWNCLIMMYCCKISSPEKSLKWTKEITNMHENLFPNPPLQRKMDLHNNQVGRDYFMKLLPTIHRQFFETSFFVDHLLELTKSIKIAENTHQEFGFELIKLEEKKGTQA